MGAVDLYAMGITAELFDELERLAPRQFVQAVGFLGGVTGHENVLTDDRLGESCARSYVEGRLARECQEEPAAARGDELPQREVSPIDPERDVIRRELADAYVRCRREFDAALAAYVGDGLPEHVATMRRAWNEWLGGGGGLEFASARFMWKMVYAGLVREAYDLYENRDPGSRFDARVRAVIVSGIQAELADIGEDDVAFSMNAELRFAKAHYADEGRYYRLALARGEVKRAFRWLGELVDDHRLVTRECLALLRYAFLPMPEEHRAAAEACIRAFMELDTLHYSYRDALANAGPRMCDEESLTGLVFGMTQDVMGFRPGRGGF